MSQFQPRYLSCDVDFISFFFFMLSLDLCYECEIVFFQAKPTISPALETAIECQMKLLSIAISYGGHALLCYKDQFKEAISYAFESPSWKVIIVIIIYLYLLIFFRLFICYLLIFFCSEEVSLYICVHEGYQLLNEIKHY